MRRILWLPLATVVLAGLVQGPKLKAAEGDEEVKKEILELEEKQNQLFLKADVNFLARIYADSIDWTRPTGEPLTKAQVLANLRSGKEKYNSITHDDLKVHVYGDTVVVTGHSTTNLQYDGKVFSSPRRFANVWVKQGGQWRLVVHHVTPIAGE
jgi:ketosteroid isomerase-like protein